MFVGSKPPQCIGVSVGSSLFLSIVCKLGVSVGRRGGMCFGSETFHRDCKAYCTNRVVVSPAALVRVSEAYCVSSCWCSSF